MGKGFTDLQIRVCENGPSVFVYFRGKEFDLRDDLLSIFQEGKSREIILDDGAVVLNAAFDEYKEIVFISTVNPSHVLVRNQEGSR